MGSRSSSDKLQGRPGVVGWETTSLSGGSGGGTMSNWRINPPFVLGSCSAHLASGVESRASAIN